MERIIFSKQADHDADLFPAWIRWYREIWRADRIIVFPVKIQSSETARTVEFYNRARAEIVPLEFDRWDAEAVWDRILGELERRIVSPGDFVLVGADADQFLPPEGRKLDSCVVWNVRRAVLNGGHVLLESAERKTIDSRAGSIGRIRHTSIGACRHASWVPLDAETPDGFDVSIRSYENFQAKVRAVSSIDWRTRTSTHWKSFIAALHEGRLREVWKDIVDTSVRDASTEPLEKFLAENMNGSST